MPHHFRSQAWQDEFVANLLNFKKDGFYLDIGSWHAIPLNNSYFFESELNWKGMCVEINPHFAPDYKNRMCHFVNDDATKIDYKSVFSEKGFPPRFDYLSIDCDDSSALVVKKLPLEDYRFSVITMEHDSYRVGNGIKDAEREILKKHNYVMLVSDVFAPLGCGMGPNLSFEDWWIDPATFDMNKLAKLFSQNMYPDDMVIKLKSMPDTYTI
jgi:hypothetical protein